MKLDKPTAELLEAYFAGDPSPDVVEAMEAWLSNDKANARLLAEYGLVDRLIAHEQKKQDAASIYAALLEAEEAAETILVEKPIEQHIHSKEPTSDAISFKEARSALTYAATTTLRTHTLAIGGIAAMLLIGISLAIALAWLLNPGPSEQITVDNSDLEPEPVQPAPIVATLTAEREAVWDRRPGDDLYAGQRFTLTQGFAEITTNKGAVAILEAPATVELINNNNALLLHTGKLVGICETESSKGLIIRTPNVDITDIGTRFGVQVNQQGDVLTAVLDGEVIVTSIDAPQIQRTLVAGQTINASHLTGLDPVAQKLSPDHTFRASWRDIHGMVHITGQARFFATPPKDVSPNALIDPDHIIVFQEQVAQTDIPLRVITELSGSSPKGSDALVPAGTRVISYMVHFSPAEFVPHDDTNEQPLNAVKATTKTASATIEFPGRVLGLIGGGDAMHATDEQLGLSSVVYTNPNNGFDVYNNMIDDWPSDSVKITGDGDNTLEITLSALTHSDQARVLIEVPADYNP